MCKCGCAESGTNQFTAPPGIPETCFQSPKAPSRDSTAILPCLNISAYSIVLEKLGTACMKCGLITAVSMKSFAFKSAKADAIGTSILLIQA